MMNKLCSHFKLNAQRRICTHVTELKSAVFAAAEGATPDTAVEKVMKDHKLALVDGKLQASQ